jgi:hypothetical protein
MHKQVIIFFTLFLLSCSQEDKIKMIEGRTGATSLGSSYHFNDEEEPMNLEFIYYVDTTDLKRTEIVRADCQLLNNGSETIYFLTYTCNGWEDNFVHNITISRVATMYCYASNPFVQAILPNDKFCFSVDFLLLDKSSKKIDLQYFIYCVPKDFCALDQKTISRLKKTIIYNSHQVNFVLNQKVN